MIDQKTLTLLVISAFISTTILLVAYFSLRDIPHLFSSVIIIAIVVFIAPISIVKYSEMSKVKLLEDSFPQFMHDLVETVRSGMTLPQALGTISKNDYGPLSPYVKKLNAQLEWGIPFSKSFLNFTRSTKSKIIGRIGSTVVESHEYGGNLTDVFESISNTTVEIERLREERKMYLNSQIVSGYIIFFVFLAVIIGLQKFLVPTLSQVSVKQMAENVIDTASQTMESEYKTIFRNMIIIQGVFAGLVIGKMSEGAVTGGVKHSLFLTIIGLVIFILSTL
jgi:flagellar protein FlaJ